MLRSSCSGLAVTSGRFPKILLAMRLEAFHTVSKLSVDEVNADHFWKSVNQAVAPDYIAWASTALFRIGWLDVPSRMPEPALIRYNPSIKQRICLKKSRP